MLGRTIISFVAVLVILSTNLAAQNGIILAREPAISEDGTMAAFSFQGDIWTIPIDGGVAKRLTIHEAYESNPIFSPDGESIAFNAGRFGNTDIFKIPSEGGKSKRLTYYSGSDNVSDWTSNNRILFTSNRTFQHVEWDSELQHISANGGTPTRLMDALGDMAVMSPNGEMIAFVRGSCRIAREQYNGPADKDVWIYHIGNKSFHPVTDNSVNDYLPKWRDDGSLYFIGASSGRYNIYEQAIDENGLAEGEPVMKTSFNNDGVRHFDVAGNGDLIFERMTDLYVQKNGSSRAGKLDIRLSDDYRFDPEENMTFTNNMSEYSVSPNGEYTAMTIRGEIFVMKNDKEDSKTTNVTKHSYRDRSPAWLNDSTLVFTSDRDGQYDLYLVRSADENKPDIFKSLKHEVIRLTNTREDEANPLISPDGKKIAYQVGRGTLITADIDENGKMSNRETLLDGWDSPGGVTWSPDSKWLAYSLSDLNFNSEVYIHAADNSKDAVNVTLHPRGDYSPFWSRDGSKLGFVSDRNNGDNDIWFVWLNEEDWLKTQEDREEGYYFDNEEEEKSEEEGEEEEEEPIIIDFEDIHERLWQVTSMPGNEWNYIISADGETFYFTASEPDASGSDLFSIKFDRSDIKQLTEGGRSPFGLSLSPDGKKIYAISRGQFNEVDPSGTFTGLPFRANMVVDHYAENEQVFEEAWRALDQGFYDPEFHGNNWEALKRKYKPWTLAASTSQDFRFMFNWMLGQLNASHMGLYGSNPEETQNERTGLLGIAVEPVRDGVRITHVIPNSPADKKQSKLYKNEIIRSVDGYEISDDVNFFSYLVNDTGAQVLLEVEGENGDRREVVIRPTNSLGDELYEEWIDSREKLVDEYSNGRLGYIHIEGMNWPSFERFERELMASGHGKEGIVIDVRWNGGGWTTDYLMTVLNVRQHAYTVPRGATNDLNDNHEDFREYYPFGERLPLSWWTRPSIALSNESSYSNAEIFSHAYKTLGIGKLVGMPTFGAVISTGGMGLMNGSFVRMPFRAWYVKATDENMENGPAVPDVLINNAPDSKAKGEDPQLRKAVEVLLADIEE